MTFGEVISRKEIVNWIIAMEDELKLVQHNEIWDIVNLLEWLKLNDYKWVYKTKKDFKGDIDGYKARLVVKVFM